jgi:hypothetical protein
MTQARIHVLVRTHWQTGIPDFPIWPESGPRFPIPGQIGNRGFPVSRFRPNRESGERELGISGSGGASACSGPGSDSGSGSGSLLGRSLGP